MTSYVADTHALYWYLTSPQKLGSVARTAFDEAERGEAQIVVPAIVLAELYWILAKQGQSDSFGKVMDSLVQADQFVLTDLRCEELRDLSIDASVPELHDRLIVGVARRRGATLLTRDREITSSRHVRVAW